MVPWSKGGIDRGHDLPILLCPLHHRDRRERQVRGGVHDVRGREGGRGDVPRPTSHRKVVAEDLWAQKDLPPSLTLHGQVVVVADPRGGEVDRGGRGVGKVPTGK